METTQPLNTNNKYGIIFDWRKAKSGEADAYSLFVGGNYYIARVYKSLSGEYHGRINDPCEFYRSDKDLETVKRCMEGSVLMFIDDVLSYGKENNDDNKA